MVCGMMMYNVYIYIHTITDRTSSWGETYQAQLGGHYCQGVKLRRFGWRDSAYWSPTRRSIWNSEATRVSGAHTENSWDLPSGYLT